MTGPGTARRAEPAVLRGRPVLVTGHTGFKGGWLGLWLAELGATVHGYALEPPTEPNLFTAAGVGRVLASDTRADLADRAALVAAMAAAQPEVVFHLAAQPLVAAGYRDPARTFTDNVLGTLNVLDAVRATPSVRAVVVIATDKVYENLETGHAFTESDALGGHDPYSASKAAAEIVVASYRASFFEAPAAADGGRAKAATAAGRAGRHPALVASARAGNVIGGGDWAADRLVPDCLRAFPAGAPVRLRHPGAVRPWQHVLEPLAGYLALAAALLGPDGVQFARAWNLGPDPADDATVGDVADRLAALWGDGARVVHDAEPVGHEAGLLRLDSTAAHQALGWAPHWDLDQALSRTVAWHRAWLAGADMAAACREQIAAHSAAGE